ncbi:enamine deaminase RidA (YjgF/YER057c/UK114 family) [Bradyrhizobium sp. i1.4.4]
MPKLDHLRPSGLHHNPAYSHVVTASGARTIYISGQVSVDEEGRIVGEGDIAAQTTQVMQNLGHALKAAGATYANIVKITTFVVNYKPELRPRSSARPARPSSKAWSRPPAPSSASPRSPRRNG